MHRYRRTKTSQPNLFGSRQTPYLEIRNQQQQQQQSSSIHHNQHHHHNNNNNNNNHHHQIKEDNVNSRELDALDINRNNHAESHVHKTALDLMPKFVLKQLNEKNKVKHYEINPNVKIIFF